MTNTIFKSMLKVSSFLLILTYVFMSVVLFKHNEREQVLQLKDALKIASIAAEQQGVEYLSRLDTSIRVTLISQEGDVLFDNTATANTLDNHLNREEIQEAIQYGQGSAQRHSDTIGEKTLYEALLLDNGQILRMSLTNVTLLANLYRLLQPFAVVIVLLIILSAWMSHKLSRKIIEPLNQLDLSSEKLEKHRELYEELTPLINKISEQKQEIVQQKQALEFQLTQFDYILTHMQEGVVLLNQSNHIMSINQTAQTILNIRGHVIGTRFDLIMRDARLLNALKKLETVDQTDFQYPIQGKTYLFILNRYSIEATNYGTMIFAVDITEQVMASKYRQAFTANVSHELKTPLQSIIGATELIEHHLVKEEDVPGFITNIQKQAKRLITLIEEVILLSKMDEQQNLVFEEVNLKDITEEIQNDLVPILTKKDITMHIEGDEGIMMGVRRLIYELIYNLCDNAIKYNHPNGNINIHIQSLPHQLRYEIADTGIGFNESEQEKIFERFYRVDKSHSQKIEGTGLGLSIVKHAVLLHHGDISVKSVLNEGTQFTLTFPK